MATSLDFFERLRWIDGKPLLGTIETYRRDIFTAALDTFRPDGLPKYNLVVSGRGKKNWKSSDLILAALYLRGGLPFSTYSSGVRTRRLDKMAADHDPVAIKDRKAHRIEFLKKWKKPKPLDLKIASSGKPSALQRGIIPALDALDVQTKWWSWNPLTQGDCTMDDATIWLSSDGTGIFSAYTKTSDDGDVWIVQALALKDNNGVALYTIPKFDGPTMSWEDSWYTVHQNLNFPAFLWSSIVSVGMTYHC
jgi:hypothetical protein